MTNLGLKIMIVRFGTKLDFLELDGCLLLPGQLLLLLLLILVFPIIHDLAHRRACIGSHFHEIESLLFGCLQSLLRGHDAKLGTVVGYYPYFTNSNLLIPSGLSSLYSSFLPF